MISITVTTKREGELPWLKAYLDDPIHFDIFLNDPNIGLVKAYHKAWEKHRSRDILVYLHDDLDIHEKDWQERVEAAFQEPRVAVVGLGGATGIGVPDIYKVPYRIEQLVRTGYASNQTDWGDHGSQETREKKVAVIDGFCMAVRGKFLEEVKGWNWIESNFHCYDTAMCLEAHRRGYEVWTTGISCTHSGGGTSTKPEYLEWCKNEGTTPENEHALPHRWLYERYRDILPLEVK